MDPGDRLGRYVLAARYALGGMAEVWLANLSGESGFKKTFVLKILHPHLADDPTCVRMFVGEALLGSMLDHPNIVPVFDHGRTDDSYFIALEFVNGRTLRSINREVARRGQRVPLNFAVRTITSVCDALSYAYSLSNDEGTPLRIVHRDITPENVMVSFKGVTKVLDFGIAKVSTAAIKTEAGVLKGKYAYLAPEQVLGVQFDGTGQADPRSDLYSLGLVLYELLTAARPFQGSSTLALLKEIVEKEPIAPRVLAPSIPAELEAICVRAIAKSADDRYQTAAEMSAALERFLHSLGPYPTQRHIAEYLQGLFSTGDNLLTPDPNRTTAARAHAPALRRPEAPVPEAPEGAREIPELDASAVELLEDGPAPAAEPTQNRSGAIPSPAVQNPGSALAATTPTASRSATAQPLWQKSQSPLSEPIAGALDDLELKLPTAPLFSELTAPAPADPPDFAEPQPGTRPQEKALPTARQPGTQGEMAAAWALDLASGPRPETHPEVAFVVPRAAGLNGKGWTMLTERLRQEKGQNGVAPSPGHPAGPTSSPGVASASGGPLTPPAARAHAWDAVVRKVLSEKAEPTAEAKKAPPPSPRPQSERHRVSDETRALLKFDQSLGHMRAKEYQSALSSLEEAIRLAPDNRLYQGNLKILKRLASEVSKP
jgi:serine/threonine protein kinase